MAKPRVNPWAREHHVLRTSLSPKQCCERLRARTAPWRSLEAFFGSWGAVGYRPVRGQVWPYRFHVLKTNSWRNSFQSDAWGRFTAVPGGTRIDVSVGQNFPIVVFEACLLVVLLLGLLAAIAIGRLLTEALGILAFLAAGVITHAVGRWGSGKDQEFLVQVVRETLEAEEVAAAPTV